MAKAKFKTPRGRTAGFVALGQPDPNYGGYKAKLSLDPSSIQELRKTAEEVAEEGLGKTKAKKCELPFVEDDEGNEYFRVKTGEQYPPVLRDARGVALKTRPNVGPGSLVRFAGTMKVQNAGGKNYVTAYLSEVKILELQEVGGNAFSDDEDDDIDEGFTAGEETTDASEQAKAAANGDTEDSDSEEEDATSF